MKYSFAKHLLKAKLTKQTNTNWSNNITTTKLLDLCKKDSLLLYSPAYKQGHITGINEVWSRNEQKDSLVIDCATDNIIIEDIP